MSLVSANFLVFGATGGVGAALARQLVAEGARVFLAGRDEGKLRTLAAELQMPLGLAMTSRIETFENCFSEAKQTLGAMQGVANCIGSVLLKPAHLTSFEDWDETLRINLTTVFATVKGAATALKPDGGSVVLVSSAATRIGLANHEAIAAAKSGIEGLTRAAAASYAAARIRVNAVSPGLVKTAMTRRLWENASAAEASTQMHALGRLGDPADVARAITFLLHPENDWITGQVLGVDGGLGSIAPRRRG